MHTQYDVVIVGAGISGIGMAHWLQKKCPKKKICILEGRDTLGGTWSLFQYPGLRSDSDMFTFGYRFKPWSNPQSLSSGADILSYVTETAQEFGIDKLIKYNHRVLNSNWSDETQSWTIDVSTPEGNIQIESQYLSFCSGYYDYKNAHRPTFAGEDQYKGKIILPQFWPTNLDYKDKKIIVVGSGATAITLVPSLIKEGAKHVTMLQRSPTYVMNLPNRNGLFIFLKKYIPNKFAYRIVRIQNVLMQVISYNLSQFFPKFMKGVIMKEAKKQLPDGYPVEKHFNPNYDPWDQRLCVVPDGDLFKSISNGNADIVTDHIDSFTTDGIKLKSGEELKADIVVLATGLKIQLAGGATFKRNNKAVVINDRMMYKGMLISGVPNLVYSFGYTNASWTLKVDLTANYLCKLINFMDKKGYKTFEAIKGNEQSEEDFLNISSGYVQRAKDILPTQGSKRPWRVYQNYIADMILTRYGSIKDKYLHFK